MENKDFKNALLAGIKKELIDFTQVQKDLKKSRKLEFRPKDRSLQSICDEISNNAYKISVILFYYTWLKHSKKYWANRNINSFWEYYCAPNNPIGRYDIDQKDKTCYWIRQDQARGATYSNYGEYVQWLLTQFIKDKIIEYELDFNEDLKEFVEK